MGKITYFVAALYQRLNDKDPDTPYLNVRIIILINIIFHFAQLNVWIKNGLHKDFFSDAESSLFFVLLLLGFIIFYISGIIFPRDRLASLEVKEKDKFICFRIALGYFFINFSFLMYLVIHYLPV